MPESNLLETYPKGNTRCKKLQNLMVDLDGALDEANKGFP